MDEEDVYFWIYNSNGDTIISAYSREEVLQALQVDADNGVPPKKLLDHLQEGDPSYWGENEVIIKGHIVVPEVIEEEAEHQYNIE